MGLCSLNVATNLETISMLKLKQHYVDYSCMSVGSSSVQMPMARLSLYTCCSRRLDEKTLAQLCALQALMCWASCCGGLCCFGASAPGCCLSSIPVVDHCWSLCVVLFHVVFHAGWLTILVHFIEVLLEVLICWLLHQPCCQCWRSPQPLWCLHTKVLELLSSLKKGMPLVEDQPDFGPCCLWQEFQLLSATVLNGLLKHRWDVVGSHLQPLPNSQECCNSKWSCLTSWACWRCRGTLVPCWVANPYITTKQDTQDRQKRPANPPARLAFRRKGNSKTTKTGQGPTKTPTQKGLPWRYCYLSTASKSKTCKRIILRQVSLWRAQRKLTRSNEQTRPINKPALYHCTQTSGAWETSMIPETATVWWCLMSLPYALALP